MINKKKIVIATIKIAIETNEVYEDEAIIEAENCELPSGYIEDSFKIIKVIDSKTE